MLTYRYLGKAFFTSHAILKLFFGVSCYEKYITPNKIATVGSMGKENSLVLFGSFRDECPWYSPYLSMISHTVHLSEAPSCEHSFDIYQAT